MKTFRLLTIFLIICCIFSLVGCEYIPSDRGEQETESPSKQYIESTVDTETSTQPEETVEVVSYDEFTSQIENSPQRMAVAYLGYFSNLNIDPFDYMEDRAPLFCEKYAFLSTIPVSNIIGSYSGELYLIIPADKDADVTVSYTGVNEDGEDISRPLYESVLGEPVMVFCNNDVTPEMQVKIEESNGNTFVWSLGLDKNGYVDMMFDDESQEMILDISPYSETLLSDYKRMAADGYIPVTDEYLLYTTWRADEYFPDSLYYKVYFDKTTANIYWMTADGEEHEYIGAPYEVKVVDGVSVLTLDLGEFGGIHKYNVLIDPDYYMLYFAVDTSAGDIVHTDEGQYRFLFRED